MDIKCFNTTIYGVKTSECCPLQVERWLLQLNFPIGCWVQKMTRDVSRFKLTTPLLRSHHTLGTSLVRPLYLRWDLPTFLAFFKYCQWVESGSDQGFSYALSRTPISQSSRPQTAAELKDCVCVFYRG